MLLWQDFSTLECPDKLDWKGDKIKVEFFLESVPLGYTNCLPHKNAITCIILVVKFFISKCKMEGRNPDFAGVQSYLKFHYNSENFACNLSHQEKFLISKWNQI